MEVTRYRAKVSRDGKFWLIHVPEIDRWTQARTLREVDEMARDLIAAMNDVEPDTIDLDVDITLPQEVSEHLQRAEALREQASQANSQAATELRTAARALAASGLSVRDLGRALGVSYQRAHQLVKS